MKLYLNDVNIIVPKHNCSWHNSQLSFLACNTSHHIVNEKCKLRVIQKCDKNVWDECMQIIGRNYRDNLKLNII